MRMLRISGIVLGCLVAAFFLLLIAVWVFVNPNDYKGRIEQDVKTETGRDLVLAGPLRLSVFPWFALRLGPASLGNPPGFGSGPFASIQYASLSVKLLPLLRERLEIGHVEVNGLDLHLVRNARGQGNWQFGTATPAAAQNTAPVSPSAGSGEELQNVAGVAIKNSRVSYGGMVIEDLNASVGRVRAAVPVPVDLKLRLLTHAGAEPVELSARLDLVRAASGEQYRIEHLILRGTWIPKPAVAAVPWGLSAPAASLDLNAQTASAPSFAAQLADAHVTGSLEGTRVLDAPNVTGTFRLEPLVLRQWMSEVALPVPETRDPKALSRLAASGDFAYGANAARAERLDVQLDDSTLRGAAAITSLASEAMTFDLALDHIDLDRYMSAAPARAPERAPTAPTALPTSSLKRLQLSGTATIGQATVERLRLSEVRVKVESSDGVLHLDPASAELYGGAYRGHVTLDARGAVPTLTLDQSLTGVDVAMLLKDLDDIDRISGRGDVTTELTGQGATSDAVLKTLSGRVTANLTNGAVEGLDLGYEINRAVALAERRPMPAGKNTGRTTFSAFKASADLKDGVATSHDLDIASPDLRITGQGTVNLLTDAIDYRVKAAILKGTAGGVLADVPLTISGTLTSPSVRPDLAELAKAGLQQALKGHRKELQQTLQNKLKGLLR